MSSASSASRPSSSAYCAALSNFAFAPGCVVDAAGADEAERGLFTVAVSRTFAGVPNENPVAAAVTVADGALKAKPPNAGTAEALVAGAAAPPKLNSPDAGAASVVVVAIPSVGAPKGNLAVVPARAGDALNVELRDTGAGGAAVVGAAGKLNRNPPEAGVVPVVAAVLVSVVPNENPAVVPVVMVDGALKVKPPTTGPADLLAVAVAAPPKLNPPDTGAAPVVVVVVPAVEAPKENPADEIPALGLALPLALAAAASSTATAGSGLSSPHATHFASALLLTTLHTEHFHWSFDALGATVHLALPQPPALTADLLFPPSPSSSPLLSPFPSLLSSLLYSQRTYQSVNASRLSADPPATFSRATPCSSGRYVAPSTVIS
jgi:hypothetical protein